MKDLLIDASNLSVVVNTFSGPLQVVRHMDLQLRRGEIVGLVCMTRTRLIPRETAFTF